MYRCLCFNLCLVVDLPATECGVYVCVCAHICACTWVCITEKRWTKLVKGCRKYVYCCFTAMGKQHAIHSSQLFSDLQRVFIQQVCSENLLYRTASSKIKGERLANFFTKDHNQFGMSPGIFHIVHTAPTAIGKLTLDHKK